MLIRCGRLFEFFKVVKLGANVTEMNVIHHMTLFLLLLGKFPYDIPRTLLALLALYLTVIPWFLISPVHKFILIGGGKRVKEWVVRTQKVCVPAQYLELSLLTKEIYII